ncbi:MAG: glutamine synthetase [Dehalococcoidia bacterium]|nr:glutamine synthetase [Dehalococcoidia bacterium]
MSYLSNGNAHEIVRFLDKPQAEFTKEDLVRYIKANDIQFVQFRHVGGDGRLKTLSFVVTDEAGIDRLLSEGERVDGSSLLPFVDPSSSDLYVVPRYKTAFRNPFTQYPTLDVLCTYYTSTGERLAAAPENVLHTAHNALKRETGFTMDALGELEYYVMFDDSHHYPVKPQRGYHESSPFCRGDVLRTEAMRALARAGVKVKYSHSEVGNITENGREMEQHEIELALTPLEDAADQLLISMWMLRMLGCQEGVTVSFAPKIVPGHAGNGMHVHTRLLRDGQSVMTEGGGLSETAKKAIAGYVSLAPSLTAFGNMVPTSYLRLVPHQEAPTNVCWGDRNRSALVRVPLGWLNLKDMAKDANPQQIADCPVHGGSQTVEVRSPDGSANIYLLLAGLAVAARHGLTMANALDVAAKRYVGVNIFAEGQEALRDSLPHLPTSCVESSAALLNDREIYERDGVFPAAVIDQTVARLKAFNDDGLVERVQGNYEEISKLIEEYILCP